MIMASLRLCVPNNSSLTATRENTIIDRCLPASDEHPGVLTLAEIRSAFTSPLQEDFVVLADAVQDDDVAALSESEHVLNGDDAGVRILYQQQAVPSGLLPWFPQGIVGLLQRPAAGDQWIVARSVFDAADTGCSLLDIWMTGGADARLSGGVPDVNRFPELGPGHPIVSAAAIQQALRTSDIVQNLPHESRQCFESGILLLWDFLELSHQISQSAEGEGDPPTADYWHGIMHRREPDPGNAGYWFRRVGRHPAMDRLAEHISSWLPELGFSAEGTTSRTWDPQAFVKRCAASLGNPESDAGRQLRAEQYLEMLNLLAEPWLHS
jgi:hypothetical protein